MKLIRSKQRNVAFILCKSGITIDKRDSWGDDPSNFQQAPNGAFLKMKNGTEVSHLVQINEKGDAPLGWVKGSIEGLFDKAPIWVSDQILNAGEMVPISTKDGNINYEVKEPSVKCYNCDAAGNVDLSDCWIQTLKNLRANYEVD